MVPGAGEAMRGLGAGRIVGAVGPCIGEEAFEVGPEVAAAFRETLGNDAPVRERGDGKAQVDLARAVMMQLRAAGVEEPDDLAACTYSDSARFFSHRRDGGKTGRMAALIGVRAEPSGVARF